MAEERLVVLCVAPFLVFCPFQGSVKALKAGSL